MAILYSFRRCPYAMRGRMALSVSGIPYEHREILLRDKPESMLAASPKGTVPVFIKDDGGVIDESLDLATWALSCHDPLGWMNGYDPALTAQNDGSFKTHLDQYKYASRYDPAKKRGDVDLSHRDAACAILNDLNQRLRGRSYLSGETQSLTDIAIFPFIRQFAAVQPQWWKSSPFEDLRAWLDRHLASELFAAIMTKRPLWVDQQPQL